MRLKNTGKLGEKLKDKTLRKMEYELGDNFYNCLLLIDADNRSHEEQYCMPHQIGNIIDRWLYLQKNGLSMKGYKLPVDGNDVMEVLHIEPSAKVKECLNWLMKFAFNNPKISREELLKQIKQFKK